MVRLQDDETFPCLYVGVVSYILSLDIYHRSELFKGILQLLVADIWTL